ncbi:protein-L-isoaspartate O-methyltransferase family protein [Streptomyces violaceusniger]|uniref:Protein-L-isoaspartate O-methyltransferase n=1 Tax=Streptomyces violaceusniger (strain Tu 4113) TaxID=653045 RepID=G2PH80_STRV4|nr:methyltransferase domain-containing protein [Streptomyces violaceusniger]AEM88726.1 protein-L-isoaspartate(D-aspartate) O-methyltransferase [Streptomyces violaceusniger Tu 4113]
MTLTTTASDAVARAAAAVPEQHYTHHPRRGATIHRSNPSVIHRELRALDVHEGMRVLEIGTGSGYSGALLSQLVGDEGRVVSLDINAFLAKWANRIHDERGLTNIGCRPADGQLGWPEDAPYDRIIAWATPPLLPATWMDQLAADGSVVAPLPLAQLPHVTAVARIRIQAQDRQPAVTEVVHGGYTEMVAQSKSDEDVPGRWVDWLDYHPETRWISTAWRHKDTYRSYGAHDALQALTSQHRHTEPYTAIPPGPEWYFLVSCFAATGDPHLTMAGIDGGFAIGHSEPGGHAAVLHKEHGLIIADAPDSPSLTVLRSWLEQWQREGTTQLTPRLVTGEQTSANTGWHLRLTRAS